MAVEQITTRKNGVIHYEATLTTTHPTPSTGAAGVHQPNRQLASYRFWKDGKEWSVGPIEVPSPTELALIFDEAIRTRPGTSPQKPR